MFLLLIFLFGSIYLYYAFNKRRDLPPGPIGFPIIGNLLKLSPTEPFISLTELAKEYGRIYGLYLGSVYTVVVTDEAIIRSALSSEDFVGRAPLYVTHGIMGGYGLICAEGELWRDQRKLSIQWLKKIGMVKFGQSRAVFEKRIMKGIDKCVKTLSKMCEKLSDIDPADTLHHAIGNIMNDIVFGLEYDTEDETWKYLKHLQEEGVKHIGVSGVVNFIPWLRFLPSNRSILEFLLKGKDKTHCIYDTIIDQVELNLDSSVNAKDSTDYSILELFLLEQRQRAQENDPKVKFCNRKQLRHLLADLFGAGVDTTLTTLRWFLLFVANNREMQKQIRSEFNKVVGQHCPRLDDYTNLHYFRACIAEAQRIRSVVPLGIPHGSIKDTKLCQYVIPKGSMILPLQWAIHMNPENWSQPKKFNPNRFINENGEFYLPQHFMPFQTGKRMCLGEELAKMLLFLFGSYILYNFEISTNILAEEHLGTCGITLVPPNYSLALKKISKNN